jgi:hypothetical protein
MSCERATVQGARARQLQALVMRPYYYLSQLTNACQKLCFRSIGKVRPVGSLSSKGIARNALRLRSPTPAVPNDSPTVIS